MSEKSQPVYYFFNCKACEEPINFRADQIYEVVANYKCALCSADNWIDPNSNNFQEIKKEKFNALRMPIIKKSKSYKKTINNKNQPIIKSSKNRNYPALAFLSKCANFIAWFGVISSMLVFPYFVDSLPSPGFEELLFPFLGLALGTFIYFVFWRALSEILILFVHIAEDVREISLRKN